MTSPPKKPHFLSFVGSNSQHGALIPIPFMSKYLNGEKCEYALLRRGCKNWGVKIDGRLFANGWKKFEKDNGLEEGDYLVFRHEGHLVFEVLVLDPTLCEREFPTSSSEVVHGVKEVDSTGEGKKSSGEAKTSKKLTPNIHGSKKIKKEKAQMLYADDKDKSSKHGDCCSFRGTLAPSSIKNSILYIPKKFARSAGLSNRKCETIIRDEKLRSWPVKVRSNGSDQVCFGRGWRHFCLGNDLQLGNEFVLELIEKGEKPIINFHGLGKKLVETPEEAETSTSAVGTYPYFIAILNECSIKKSTLYLPNDFARKNGLSDGEMILRNENQNSWIVELRDKGKYVYIGCGWHDFQVVNNLKEGDCFKFELVENMKKPIVNFSRMISILTMAWKTSGTEWQKQLTFGLDVTDKVQVHETLFLRIYVQNLMDTALEGKQQHETWMARFAENDKF